MDKVPKLSQFFTCDSKVGADGEDMATTTFASEQLQVQPLVSEDNHQPMSETPPAESEDPGE